MNDAVGEAYDVLAAARVAPNAPLHAGEVRQGQGELGQVGLDAAAADAAVGQHVAVAGVKLGVSGRVLRADEGAAADLALAPLVADLGRDRVRIDIVGGRSDGGEDAGDG